MDRPKIGRMAPGGAPAAAVEFRRALDARRPHLPPAGTPRRPPGYNLRALVEADVPWWKGVIGGGPRSRADDRRSTEVVTAARALDRTLELGRPEYLRIAAPARRCTRPCHDARLAATARSLQVGAPGGSEGHGRARARSHAGEASFAAEPDLRSGHPAQPRCLRGFPASRLHQGARGERELQSCRDLRHRLLVGAPWAEQPVGGAFDAVGEGRSEERRLRGRRRRGAARRAGAADTGAHEARRRDAPLGPSRKPPARADGPECQRSLFAFPLSCARSPPRGRARDS
jgi:hypothetical protein